ncbi:MAG: motility protein A [Spirochaetaceae bacterium]|jgi:chemotaxis protein MotA|nr:motility protein A [Spirochaetaceae bacterium]
MDIATIGGFIGGILLIIGGILFAGNSMTLYLNAPSFLIVIGGSFAAMIAATPLSRSLGMMKFLKNAFFLQVFNKDELIRQLVAFSESARKEGLLSLDDALNDVEDEFMKGGMRLVVDGTDPDVIKKVLYTNLNQIEARHQKGINFVSGWNTVAPAFGMIGTLLGLIGMMANLEDTASVGPNMATALITTLYGSLFSNLFLTPLRFKLEDRNADEMLVKEIMIEGILSIQSGDNPRILEQKLYTFLAPSDRPSGGGVGEE